MEHLTCADEQVGEAPEQSFQAPAQSPNWILSETTSPVDHKPQIVARTTARAGAKDGPSSLAFYCRANRTEVLLSPASSWTKPPGTDIRVVFQINDQPPVDQRWRVVGGGRSLAFPGDAARFMSSIPDGGRLLTKVYAGTDAPYEETFEMTGLDAVRRRLAKVCTRAPS